MKHLRVPALILFGVFWLACVVCGGFVLYGYAQSPGESAAAPSQWPSSAGIHRLSHSTTLLVFLHPDCSCSRATLQELSKALVFAPEGMKTYAVFIRPEGWTDVQMHGELWRQASAIAGISVTEDLYGDAKRFGAKTSGHMVLYDALGRLQFYGGITAARGHSGDNLGEALVVKALQGLAGGVQHTDVFGCGIFASASINRVSRWASQLTNWGK